MTLILLLLRMILFVQCKFLEDARHIRVGTCCLVRLGESHERAEKCLY